MIVDLEKLKEIAEVEFRDIVDDAIITGINELRVILKDSSFLDIWFSLKLKSRYSFHWERRHIDNTIYRHDNAPHIKWQYVTTFPKHFHDGNESKVIESNLSDIPEGSFKEFLQFIKENLQK